MDAGEHGFQRVIAEVQRLQDSLRSEHERHASELKAQLRDLQKANAELLAQLRERDQCRDQSRDHRGTTPSTDVPTHSSEGAVSTRDMGGPRIKTVRKPLPATELPKPPTVHGQPEADKDNEEQLGEPSEGSSSVAGFLHRSMSSESMLVAEKRRSTLEAEEEGSDDADALVWESRDWNQLPPVPLAKCLHLEAEHPEVIVRKLLVKLGPLEEGTYISDTVLFQAITRMGLSKYTQADIRVFIESLNTAVFQKRRGSHSRTTSMFVDGDLGVGLGSMMLGVGRVSSKAIDASPRWLGLRSTDKQEKPKQNVFKRSLTWSLTPLDFLGWRIEFTKFVTFFTDPELFSTLLPATADMFYTIAEILVSGDANQLVAELTNTVIDDLASPPPRMDITTKMEPIGSLLIIINAVLIGVQADRRMEMWEGWLYIESFFVAFFCIEMLIRAIASGLKMYFFGPDWVWNNFDLAIIVMAILDLAVQVSGAELNGSGTSTILRLCRLTRLSRLFRMLRFQMLRELTLMLKGLLAGLRTLAWAMVLLMTAIYAIAVVLTSVVGNSEGIQILIPDSGEYFSTVPRSMFTAFRCLTSDCADKEGRSLVALLASEMGFMFTVPYIGTVMLVTFGIFNLIMAIYVESTLTSAKRQDEVDARKTKNESLRIARSTKMLLKKFCIIYRNFGSQLLGDSEHGVDSQTLQEGLEAGTVPITKDVFLLALQDQDVQNLMDDLDIVPNRAHLFDALDAKGVGSIQLTDLMHGLLKVRGDAYKSDIIACLMAVKALQESVQALREETSRMGRSRSREILRAASRGTSPKSPCSRRPSRKPTLRSEPPSHLKRLVPDLEEVVALAESPRKLTLDM